MTLITTSYGDIHVEAPTGLLGVAISSAVSVQGFTMPAKQEAEGWDVIECSTETFAWPSDGTPHRTVKEALFYWLCSNPDQTAVDAARALGLDLAACIDLSEELLGEGLLETTE